MSRPRTQYTKSGDVTIAYQTVGNGPIDLIYAQGWLTNIEYAWESPDYARFLTALSSFSRLMFFDKRGTGLSDRDVGLPTLEHVMDDIRAVMDAVGSERTALFGVSEGGNMSTLFAATYPERTLALVLYGCHARGSWAPDYPWRPKPEEIEVYLAELERNWGEPFDLEEAAPSVANDESARAWFAAYLRFSASPKTARAITHMHMQIDIRDVLPTVNVPTLVLRRRGDRWSHREEARYLADQIPGARYVELPGEDHMPWWGDQDRSNAEIEEFLTGRRRTPSPERVLLTVLMTDIVGSTEKATELGDQRWKSLLQQHDTVVRRQVRNFQGQEVNTTGDGFVLAFTGPTRAIQCAQAIKRDLQALGLDIRVGLHTGECERRGGDLSGVALHIASRILDIARPGSILVSNTVKDLVVGSGIEFAERGTHALKGVPGDRTLFAVTE
ncbi:MAG: adenylate/guanylate cyclase domain-containing protein [Kiloniellales bacterium]